MQPLLLLLLGGEVVGFVVAVAATVVAVPDVSTPAPPTGTSCAKNNAVVAVLLQFHFLRLLCGIPEGRFLTSSVSSTKSSSFPKTTRASSSLSWDAHCNDGDVSNDMAPTTSTNGTSHYCTTLFTIGGVRPRLSTSWQRFRIDRDRHHRENQFSNNIGWRSSRWNPDDE